MATPSTSRMVNKPKLNFECRLSLIKHLIADSKWHRKFKNFKQQMIISKSFHIVNRFLLNNCRFLDTSLSQTVRLLFHKGPKMSIPLKEPLFFGILRLLRPANFTLGGFYSSDLNRLQMLFERSNPLLSNQLHKFSFNGRLSSANECVELARDLKQMAINLYSLEVGFFLIIDRVTKTGIDQILQDLQVLSDNLKEHVESITINLNIGLKSENYGQQLELATESGFFTLPYKFSSSVDGCKNRVFSYLFKFENNANVCLQLRQNPEWTYNPITEFMCAKQ